MKIPFLAATFLLLESFFGKKCPAQNSNAFIIPIESKTVTMPAGAHFAASRWKQLWWGKHWRDEWLTAVSFPIFDLDTTAGGLTALKRGGGHETKTLRLIGENKKEYVLRTMDKNLDVLIPDEFKRSFISDLVNDQISTAHPYGSLVVANLSGGIGIMHTNPVIVYVPDHSRLAEFRNDFAGKLCLFEERPSGDGWDNTSLTRYASEIINTEKLLKRMTASSSNLPDQKEFLKIRLLDMLINDWDRHEDQWVWTAQKKDSETIYQPFARDRDQSFSKTDGINLYLLSRPWALRAVQNMDARVTDVIGSNMSAIIIDRKLTNELTETEWKQTILAFQQSMTDSIIQEALKKMPLAVYELSGEFLFNRLRQRRDDMLRFGMRYYKILNKEVTITGTEQDELFIINTIRNNSIEIIVKPLNERQEPGNAFFNRKFIYSTTKEINLYGLSGNDQFIYSGKSKSNIKVRVLGGEDKDVYHNNSDKKTYVKKSTIYDVNDDRPHGEENLHYKAISDTSVTNYHKAAFKYDWWMPLFIPGYNPDDGFVIGTGLTYRKQQWNKHPFGWQQTFRGDYAAATGAFNLYYKGIFKQVFRTWDLELSASYKAPGFVLNYYGAGNETVLISPDKSFYRVRATSFYFNPGVSREWKKNYIKAGLIFNSVKIESADNKFVNQAAAHIDSSVFNTKNFAGINLAYDYKTINDEKYPTSGIRFAISSAYVKNLDESGKDFTRLESGFTFYYTPFKGVTLAHRTGSSTNFGQYEFYQANTIGGSENLRGYWRTRFSGRTSFYQNTDIRIQLAYLKGYVFRGSLGIYGFFDDGRVWIKGEHSNTIHTGYGGGIYFIPYRTLAINVSYASSREVNVFTFRTGFLF